MQHPSKATLKECDEAVEAYQLSGNRMGISLVTAIMAELCGQISLWERGLRYIDRALVYVGRSGERFAQADLYRIKGELLYAVNRIDDGKYWLNRAVRLAQKQERERGKCKPRFRWPGSFWIDRNSKKPADCWLPGVWTFRA